MKLGTAPLVKLKFGLMSGAKAGVCCGGTVGVAPKANTPAEAAGGTVEPVPA